MIANQSYKSELKIFVDILEEDQPPPFLPISAPTPAVSPSLCVCPSVSSLASNKSVVEQS